MDFLDELMEQGKNIDPDFEEKVESAVRRRVAARVLNRAVLRHDATRSSAATSANSVTKDTRLTVREASS